MEAIGNFRQSIYDKEETKMQIYRTEREKRNMVSGYKHLFLHVPELKLKNINPLGMEKYGWMVAPTFWWLERIKMSNNSWDYWRELKPTLMVAGKVKNLI